MSSLTIENPKRQKADSIPSTWYPFYPGFSENFAHKIISSAGLCQQDWVLDPWNGSGTTTSATVSLGVNAYGFDLNPVMVLVAKARSLDPSEYPSIQPLSSELRLQARRAFNLQKNDPLVAWLIPESAEAVRSIEAGIQTLLIDHDRYLTLGQRSIESVSDLAAFFYIALFRSLRLILSPFGTSNPTWIKRPVSGRGRLR